MSEGYTGLPPYYVQSSDPITPNLLLSLKGMDPIVAENFVIIDTAVGIGGSSVRINGSVIPNVNFVNSATATFSVVGSNVSITAAGGGASVLLNPTADQTIVGDHALLFSGTGNIAIYPNIDAAGGPAIQLGTGDINNQTGEYTGIIDQVGNIKGLLVSDGTGDSVVLALVGPSPVFNLNDAAGNTFSGSTTAITVSATGAAQQVLMTVENGFPEFDFVNATTGSASLVFLGTAVTHPLALPLTNGTAGQVLTTNGANPQQLSWTNAAAGTVTSFSSGNFDAVATTSVATSTTTPALTFTLSTQAANTVWAGPTSGAAAAPTFRSLVSADIPSLPYIPTSLMTTLGDTIYENATPAPARLAGNITTTKMYLSQTGNGSISAAPAWAQINYADITGTAPTPPSGAVLWSALGNAAGNLTLLNATNTTTFQQTTNAAWLWANTTTGTAITTNASPTIGVGANYFNGATSAADIWTIGSSLAAGTNGVTSLNLTHTGSPSNPAIINIVHSSNVAITTASNLVLGSTGGGNVTLSTTSGLVTWTNTFSIPGSLGVGVTGTSKFIMANTGVATKYNNIALTGNGIASEVGVVTATTASAAVAATTLLAAPVAATLYRVSAYLKVTAVTVAPVAGPVTLTYADKDGVAQSVVMALQSAAGVTTTTTGATTTLPAMGSTLVYCNSGTALQYAIAFSGSGTYEYKLICEAL